MSALNLQDRRRAFRVTPNPLTVINFPSGNCAVVLDISSNGLGFLAASPLENVHARDFRLSFKSIAGVEAAGELVWKDTSGKRGGVRFTHLPEVIREQPSVWLRQSQSQTPASTSIEAVLQTDEGAVFTRTNAPSLTNPVPLFPEESPAPRPAIAVNVLTFALALIVAVGVWSSIYKREASEAFAQFRSMNFRGIHSLSVVRTWISNLRRAPGVIVPTAESASGIPPSVTAPPLASDVPAQSSTAPPAIPPASAPVAKVAAQAKITPSQAAKKLSQTGSAVVKAPRDASPANVPLSEGSSLDVKGQAELALARGFLQGDATEKDTAKAAPLLWLAVQKGNTDAEVDLADLYVRGDGVPRSCEQARVLLTAADKSENKLAGKKLSELDASCQ